MKPSLCPECRSPMQGKAACACGWRQEKEKRTPTACCQKCGERHLVKDLNNYGALEVCNDCLMEAQLDPETRAYFKEMERTLGFKVSGMPCHLAAANATNMKLDDYLKTMPRSCEEFLLIFKGTDWEGLAIKLTRKKN